MTFVVVVLTFDFVAVFFIFQKKEEHTFGFSDYCDTT